MKIHIKNGRVIDPISQLDSQLDVYIGAGKILALGNAPAGFVANQIIDASNLIVCPGLVDLSARLREPGEEYKATLVSELQAAVAGGVTSFAQIAGWSPEDVASVDAELALKGKIEKEGWIAQAKDLA